MQKLSEVKTFSGLENFVPAILQSGIEIYPYQIEASLSALDNPFRKGFVLCDEVGLGKGIEAMLVLLKDIMKIKKSSLMSPLNFWNSGRI
jgi:hypothetical protein